MELPGSLGSQQSQEPGAPPPSTAEALRRMTQAWINENCAPEILPYEPEPVEILMNAIADQTVKIEEINNRDKNTSHAVLLATIYQVELDRVKYVLQAYLRARIQKIDATAVYIMSKPELQARLSVAELTYTAKFRDNLEAHLTNAFLKLLPEQYRKLNEQTNEVNMNPEPNLDTYVYVRAKIDIGEYLLSNGTPVSFQENDVYLMRYRDIQNLLLEKKVILI